MAEQMHEIEAHPHADRRLGAIGLDMRPRRGARQIFVAGDPDGAQLAQRLAELDLLQIFGILADAAVEFRGQRLFFLAIFALARNLPVEARGAELGNAVDEIAEHVGKVLIGDRREMLPGEG